MILRFILSDFVELIISRVIELCDIKVKIYSNKNILNLIVSPVIRLLFNYL